MKGNTWYLLAAVILWLVMSATPIIMLMILFSMIFGNTLGGIIGLAVGVVLVAIYVVHRIKEKL